MKRFNDYVVALLAVLMDARRISLGDCPPKQWGALRDNAPSVAIIGAHPDDEILMGMSLGMRLRRAGYQITVVPVTLGRPDQIERRTSELQAACTFFGAELKIPCKGRGLRHLIKSGRSADLYSASQQIVDILAETQPEVIITHHHQDGHHDHIITNYLVNDAMNKTTGLNCVLALGEYWRDLENPNLQLELEIHDVADLLEGLSFHKGELDRNPYHLLWPLEMIVNARYGELVTGWGTPACSFAFSVMYRLTHWIRGHSSNYLAPLQLAANQPIELILPNYL